MLLTSDKLYCNICRRRAASSEDSFGGTTGSRQGASPSGGPSIGLIGSTRFTVGILVLLLCSSKLSVLVSAVKLTLFLELPDLLLSLDLASEEFDPSVLGAFRLSFADSALILLSDDGCWVFCESCAEEPLSSPFDGRSFTPALRRLSRS